MPPNVGPGSFSTMKHVMPSSVRAASATMPGALAVRDPHLRSGDHVLVAVTYRAARDVASVAPGVGLGKRQAAPQLARRQPRQPTLLLLPRAVAHDHACRDRVRVDDAGERHPPRRELLDDRDVRQQVQAQTTEMLGDRDPEQPHRLHLLDDVGRVLVRVLEVARDRQHLSLDPAPHPGSQLVPDLLVNRGSHGREGTRSGRFGRRKVRGTCEGPGTLARLMMHQTMMSFRRDPSAVKGKHLERDLLRRVLEMTAPYTGALVGFLISVIAAAVIGVIPALLFRSLIDTAVPDKNTTLVLVLAAGAVAVAFGERSAQPGATLVLRPRGRGPHLRHAGRAVRPRAAPAHLVLHPHADRVAA